MEAIVRSSRIDILGVGPFPKEKWERLLDELHAQHVPAFMPTGMRMSVVITLTGRVDAFIFRTTPMIDEEIICVLGKYGIEVRVESEKAASASG